jgi:hypothetical protein
VRREISTGGTPVRKRSGSSVTTEYNQSQTARQSNSFHQLASRAYITWLAWLRNFTKITTIQCRQKPEAPGSYSFDSVDHSTCSDMKLTEKTTIVHESSQFLCIAITCTDSQLLCDTRRYWSNVILVGLVYAVVCLETPLMLVNLLRLQRSVFVAKRLCFESLPRELQS